MNIRDTNRALARHILRIGIVVLAALSSGCWPPYTGASKSRLSSPMKYSLPPADSDPSGVRFVDIARQAGLNYRYTIAGPRPLTILQTMGGGCAFLDFNRDGKLDILLVGNPVPQLYRGDGQGHFVNVGAKMGFSPKLPTSDALWQGCAVGDYDNDGYPDIYLSGYRCGQLWHNVQGKRWEEVTVQAGLPAQWYSYWGTSCGFADLYGEGKLDLLIGNYVLFGSDPRRFPQTCNEGHNTQVSCNPTAYYGQDPLLFHNRGAGRFEPVEDKGLPHNGQKTLALAFADFDGCGRQSAYLANDDTLCSLLQRNQKGHFVNLGGISGTACALQGSAFSAMGADWADYDGDGRMDLAVSNYTGQGKPLFHNLGNGLFMDVQNAAGLGATSAPYMAFGVKWLDYDNDGWPDLAFANGDIADTIQGAHPERRYRYPMQIFHNRGTTGQSGPVRFECVGANMGQDINRPIVGRGLATGDFDNDGRIDLLVVDAEGTPLLLHNEGGHVGHWLGLSLHGAGHSNRDAIGARVTVTLGKRALVKEVQTAGSYESASDPRLLFGLGEATKIDHVVVRWPDGKIQRWQGLPINRYIDLTERRNDR